MYRNYRLSEPERTQQRLEWGGGGVANAISTVDGDITIFPSPQPLAKVDSLFPLE